MADRALSKLSDLRPKSSSLLAHHHCPCKSPLSSSSLGCNHSPSDLYLKASRQFHRARFGSSANARTCPRFANRLLLQQLGGGLGGRASSQIAAASLRTNLAESESALPPSSKEEAVRQAGASVLALLDKALKQQGPTTVKQRKAQRQIRLRVDIPLLEDSRQALFTLTRELVESFIGGKKGAGTVAVYLPESLLLDGAVPVPPPTGTGPTERYLSLESREVLPKDAVVAFVISPRFLQAASLETVARNAGVRPIVVVNPEWSEEEEQSKTWGAFLTSFCVAYSFVPLNIQGFFSKTEGAVLKHVRSGAPEGRPWLIFVKEGDNYKCVSSLKKRPTSANLENALYSSIAANSPVNKSIMFLRGLISK